MNIKNFIKHPKQYFNKGFDIIKNYYRSQFYKGQKVICELCEWEGIQFFNNKCPKCNSLPRTRLIPFSLRHFNLVNPHLSILHIAPNVHEYQFVRKKMPSLAQYDRLNNRAVRFINVVQDITHTTLADATYDLVICWHVLEHIPDDIKAISEVYRLLKPNGTFLVSVPIYPVGNLKSYEDATIEYKDYERIHGHFDHCRSCGLDYYQRFEAIGFITQTLEVKSLDSTDIVRFGLQEGHVVWCFTK